MLAIVFVWLFLLLLLHKTQLRFFKFIIGSIGLFWFLLYYGDGIFEVYILKALSYALVWISKYIDFLIIYPNYGMLTINHGQDVITFFLDYECTGIIEILVYLSLLAFYPIHTGLGKIIYGAFGILYITGVNIIRVLIIVIVIHLLGMEYFFMAHTILARLVFFVFVVSLYYKTFTLPHIRIQEVGDSK